MLRFSLTTAIMIASPLILGDQLTRLVVAVAIAFAVLPIWKAVSEHHYQRGIDRGYDAGWNDGLRLGKNVMLVELIADVHQQDGQDSPAPAPVAPDRLRP